MYLQDTLWKSVHASLTWLNNNNNQNNNNKEYIEHLQEFNIHTVLYWKLT